MLNILLFWLYLLQHLIEYVRGAAKKRTRTFRRDEILVLMWSLASPAKPPKPDLQEIALLSTENLACYAITAPSEQSIDN